MKAAESSLSAISRPVAIVIVVIIIVAGVVGGLYAISGPLSVSFNVGTSTNVGVVGEPISFLVIPSISGATVNSVFWNFGDGTNQTTNGASTSHTYANGGYYLIWAQVTASYQNLLRSFSTTVTNNLALFPLQVQPNLTISQAANASVPTVNFPISQNPKAPVFNTGETVYPVGGYLQPPTNVNWTIQKYAWDFGNGNKPGVSANSTTRLPLTNVTTSYSNTGLYPLSLTLTTNSSSGATFSVTTIHTVVIQSTTSPFALLTTTGGVLNPGVITEAEVQTGGPYSIDPAIDYDNQGLEIFSNIFQTLVQYNGSSTTSFIPVLAAALPTQQNGGISSDFKTYNFTIRNNQYFSNGDRVTAYDVWFSLVRGMAFASGSPGTPTWVLDQFLIPGVQNGTASVYTNNTWTAASTTITYSNVSNTVAFHFNRPVPQAVALQVLSDWQGVGIVDSKYAASVGASFAKSSQGFEAYKNQGSSGSYNTKMQWSPIGSGPYMIQSLIPGQSVELVPNPKYGGIPGVPKANTTVIIDWVRSADVALLMLQDGQADAASYMPTSDFPAIQQLQSKGLVHIYSYHTFYMSFFIFNININKATEALQMGSGLTEPSNYFADLPTRLAWINSFDYQGFLSNILGNAKYGTTFGTPYQGIIPQGMLDYVPPDQLGGLPTQNLNNARGNFSISAWHNMKITIPIVVWAGDPIQLAAGQEWATTLGQISGGNITARVVPLLKVIVTGNYIQNNNPMPVSFLDETPDYPDPADYVDVCYVEGGFFASGDNWAVSNFASLPPPNPNGLVHTPNGTFTQSQVYGWLNGNISMADKSVDPNVRQKGYKIAEILAIDLGLYVYMADVNFFLYFRSSLSGYQYQENAVIGISGGLIFYWLAKGQ